jgi:PQQ-like domain
VLGPDWDFAAPAALATTSDGRDILIAPQKQGLVWAVNPDNGQVIWKQDVAREIAGGRGETLFGGAVDNEKAYFGLISSGHLALDLKTGEEVWYTPLASPEGRQNQRGVVGAVTLIPGVLLSGARDGMIRAASSRTGQLLWEFDSAQEFTTVNGVPARGGSAASGGPSVANGMVFIGSGYPGFQGGQPGNVLLAFAPAVRLDVHADELKRKAAGTPDGRWSAWSIDRQDAATRAAIACARRDKQALRGIASAPSDARCSLNIVTILHEFHKAITDIGLIAALHQHTGTAVETRDETYATMEAVDRRYVKVRSTAQIAHDWLVGHGLPMKA